MSRVIAPPFALEPEEWLPGDLFADLSTFDQLLRQRCGVMLPTGPRAARAGSHLLDLVSAFRKETRDDPTIDGRNGWRTAVGFADIAKKAVYIADQDDFAQLCPHFALFLEESAIVQNVRSLCTDAVSNKLFELLIAMSVMQIARQVRVDHPTASRGDNPDVIGVVRGSVWGFACKALHTVNLKSYVDNVAKAVDQIERSPTELGFVVVNLKNVMDHDTLWLADQLPDGTYCYGAWPSLEHASAAVEGFVENVFLRDWEAAFGGDAEIKALFAGKKAAPVILNYVNATVLILRRGRPVLTSLRFIIPLFLGLPVDDRSTALLKLLDSAIQRP